MIDSQNIHKSSLHAIMGLLLDGFSELNITFDHRVIEEFSIIIYTVMEARWRRYHDISHVFEICNCDDPIQILAGLFHDLVYLQVDRRVHPLLEKYLSEVLPLQPGYKVSVLSPTDSHTPILVKLVNEVFGYKDEAILTPTSGANEYLSAIVAARLLEPLTPSLNILRVVACIEQTIPFRNNKDGNSPSDLLTERVNACAERLRISISNRDLDSLIGSAVDFGNRDVQGFAFDDLQAFHNQMWALILEGNVVLKNPLFTTSQYRLALMKVESFYKTLTPEIIFHDCQASSFDSKKVEELRTRAKKNLRQIQEFLRTKLITISIVEATAELSGGDVPLVLFIGKAKANKDDRSVEDFLNYDIPLTNEKHEAEVLKLLNEGFGDVLFGDKKKESISAYLFQRLTQKERGDHFGYSLAYFKKEISADELLRSIRQDIRESVIAAISVMAITRSKEILTISRRTRFK